ncbi:chemotaxis protein CheR [Bacillus sp. M6-12]|uniref:CheR family methyltransferase n=1 Tax=Bacillus sp. M6-12 TaxID=2054166 RepID=UPI000C792B3D|nr:protein-glutamate O-methyltransferase CheR [Bacillus sp. M6-12]PLS19537.1 chemotaxis protein CheR [Bacillus sp. M6-12]
MQVKITDDYVEFTKKFYQLSGINLELYKRPQMERRLTALRVQHGHKNFLSYFKELEKSPVMIEEFLNKMTINVTEFFRNQERWDALQPVLKDLEKTSSSLKVWSSACSTGQEPYTLSMLLQETVKKPFSILATDIDKTVLEFAKKGIYSPVHVKSVPENYKGKHFKQGNNSWEIDAKTRKPITFKQHNLLEDPYPNGYDLIVCRNVMIYFTEEAKKHIFEAFAKALRPGGILFVGATEQIQDAKKYGLDVVKSFIYRKV